MCLPSFPSLVTYRVSWSLSPLFSALQIVLSTHTKIQRLPGRYIILLIMPCEVVWTLWERVPHNTKSVG